MAYINHEQQAPDIDIPLDFTQYVNWFWDIRAFAGSVDNPVNMDHINQWSSHTYNELQRYERDFIFGMDRAFRHAHSEMIKFHSKRPKISLDDKDRSRLK